MSDHPDCDCEPIRFADRWTHAPDCTYAQHVQALMFATSPKPPELHKRIAELFGL